MELKKLREDFFNTAVELNLSVISNEKCSQVLAWVYCFGGYTEESTHNVKLNSHILYAQKKLNAFGSEKVDFENVLLIKKNVNELNEYIKNQELKPNWLEEIEKEYKIKYKVHKK